MENNELKSVIEAMIFVAEEPVDEKALHTMLSDANVDMERIQQTLEEIQNDWNQDARRGIGLMQVSGGYQFRTKPVATPWLQKMNLPKAAKLSPASLETLAIIAYRQPCIRSEIESIRGVDSGGVIKTLLEKRLVKIVGRRDEAGQPLIYGTTPQFLELFNLNALHDLPTLKDIEEFMRERRAAMTEAPASSSLVAEKNGGDDEAFEEPEEEEEETEVIEEVDESEDEEALEKLEESLKHLNVVEKTVLMMGGFKHAEPEGMGEKGKLGAEVQRSSETEPSVVQADAPAGEDSAQSPDRPVQ
ncbi:MAG: SMC-Scp complex subunit ScpB [Deltaproteobacteria bacterium]|nr:SMC-Scp complex subunit ScpB [Deltaproteobacteria bacterium]